MERHDSITARRVEIRAVLRLARRVALSDAKVSITGKSGASDGRGISFAMERLA
jgi:DNA-binding NtrC family response regulator